MSLLTPNTDFYDNSYDRERYLLVWRFSFLLTCLFAVLLIHAIVDYPVAILPVSITFLIASISTIYLKYNRNYILFYWIYAITGTVMSHFAMNYVLTSVHSVDFIWILTCVFIAFIGLGRKTGVIFLIVNCIGIFYYFAFTLNKILEVIEPKTTWSLVADLLELIFAFIVITYLMFKFAQFQLISENELKIANLKSQEKTNENRVLVKEIHHRVKNNLQIIISLLRLQQNEIKREDIKLHFSEAINRIMVMSLIHQKLYQDKNLAEIKIQPYLLDLTSAISSLSTLSMPIKIDVQSDIKIIGLKTIVPLGLIINELMSNSIEHAFENNKEALVTIKIENNNDTTFQLKYADNGSWNSKSEEYTSFGLELIDILTSQLDGEFIRDVNEKGTVYQFTLHNLDLEHN